MYSPTHIADAQREILLGAHYLPFVFLYGMMMFAVFGSLPDRRRHDNRVMHFSTSFSLGASYTAVLVLVFASAGRAIVHREQRGD